MQNTVFEAPHYPKYNVQNLKHLLFYLNDLNKEWIENDLFNLNTKWSYFSYIVSKIKIIKLSKWFIISNNHFLSTFRINFAHGWSEIYGPPVIQKTKTGIHLYQVFERAFSNQSTMSKGRQEGVAVASRVSALTFTTPSSLTETAEPAPSCRFPPSSPPTLASTGRNGYAAFHRQMASQPLPGPTTSV